MKGVVGFHPANAPALSAELDCDDPRLAGTPCSFAVPMTPRTVAGAGKFVRQ